MGEREDRFTRLFAAAYRPLVSYALRRVPADDADDLVAEVLTVAWRKLDEVPEGDGELPWLYAVAYRTAANLHRSSRRRLRLVERLRTTDSAPHDAPSGGDPEALAALSALRPADQEILRLAAWEDLQPAQIAVVLRCSPNAAAIRLSRARQRFRDQLKGSASSRTHDPRREIDD